MSGVAQLTQEELQAVWRNPKSGLQWRCLFVLPVWLKAWWDAFGEGEPLILLVSDENDAPLGIAPLKLQGETASFLGSSDVCDYQDFILTPGGETEFIRLLFDDLRSRGIKRLDLKSVRPDASAARLISAARRAGYRIKSDAKELTVIAALPDTWEDYLSGLSGKHRHEIRRKFRRLHEAGSAAFHVKENRTGIREALPTFLHLFKISRSDKAGFMTTRMERFFTSLVEGLGRENFLKLYFLDLEGRPAAAALCFEFGATMYLYNSGYDPRYRSLSVGLLNKAHSLRDSIARGKRQYDFLTGGEAYKYRLGGIPLQLYRYRLDLQEGK